MRTSYSVRLSGRSVAVYDASSPAEALVEYLHAQGCRNEEIQRLRPDALAWRGAVFTARAAAGDLLVASRHPG
jgi:hypothetical protein